MLPTSHTRFAKIFANLLPTFWQPLQTFTNLLPISCKPRGFTENHRRGPRRPPKTLCLGSGLETPNPEPPTSNRQPPTADRRPPTAQRQLPTTTTRRSREQSPHRQPRREAQQRSRNETPARQRIKTERDHGFARPQNRKTAKEGARNQVILLTKLTG